MFKLLRLLTLCLSFLLLISQAYSQEVKTETKQRIKMVENGKTIELEIVEKDGKTLVNGKPVSELTTEERAVYEKFKNNAQNEFKFKSENGNAVGVMRRNGDMEREVEVKVNDDGSVVVNGEVVGKAQEGESEYEVDGAKVRVFRNNKGNHVYFDDDDNEAKFRLEGNAPFAVFKDEDGHVIELEKEFQWRGDVEMPDMPEMHQFGFNMEHDIPFKVYMDKLVDGVHMKMNDFQMGMNAEIMKLEAETRELARKIKNVDTDDVQALRADLQSKLEMLFEKKLEFQEEHLKKLEEEMNHQREILEKRVQNRREIVEKRLKELLNENDWMDW